MYFAMVCLWETGLHHCIRGKTVRKVSPLSRYISSPKMELFNTRTVGCKCGVVLSLLPIAVCLVHVAHTFWPHACRCEIMSSIHQLPKHVCWGSRHFGLPPRDIKSTPFRVILIHTHTPCIFFFGFCETLTYFDSIVLWDSEVPWSILRNVEVPWITLKYLERLWRTLRDPEGL